MAKRSNNSLGRRAYGGKPYDANNSFVKKMATKVTDFIPQRSWISKWFNSSEDNGETNDNENPEEGDTEEEVQPPASKRPRIRMDVTHPPGTFSIRGRGSEASNDNHSRKDPFSHVNETQGEDFLEPPVAGPSGVRRFVASTPAINTQRLELNTLIPSRNNRTSNGADDNSESSESTSGCSSLIPQTNRQEAPTNSAYNSNLASRKRIIDEKMSFTNHLQSPRCLFLESGSRESLSSRRPSFNASMMTNTLDRTSALSSPFYTGNVTFGGANALSHYKPSRSLFNSTNEFQLKVPRRTSVQVKPSNSESIDSSGMSQTAKRILEAMEYFSSPISDAKKIPIKNTASPASGRKRLREDEAQGATARVGLRHLTRELSVPTVPEMLKLRRRQKLQDTTLAARKIVSAISGPPSITPANAAQSEEYLENPAPPEEYQLRRVSANENPKFHGKLRGKLKKTINDEAPAPSVNLPRISLPITSLPSFAPLPKYAKPVITTDHETWKNPIKDTFKFASPIKMSKATWNLKSINNFSFSKPLNAEEGRDPDESRGEFDHSSKTVSVDSNSSFFAPPSDGANSSNFMWQNSSTAPRLKVKTKPKDNTESNSVAKESFELKTGSVMDILGSKTSTSVVADSSVSTPTKGKTHRAFAVKTAPEIWECLDCYIKNDASEKICVACKASKPNGTGSKISTPAASLASKTANPQPRSDTFGAQFKMNSNQWECQSCLVRNQQNDAKCVSCATPKPAEKSAAPAAAESLLSVSAAKSSLMDKFKAPEGSWECPGCMLRNPSAVITCPCCKAAKPSSLKISPNKTSEKYGGKASEINSDSNSLMDKFKPASSTWECSSCMVRNNDNASSCVCCSNPKPGNSGKSNTSVKSTETPITSSGWGDKFKKPEGSWSCDSCMVQNKSQVTECVACGGLKPGATAKPAAAGFSFGIPANSQNFSFGIDKANEKSAKTSQASSNGFSFGAKTFNSENESAANKFTFGIPKDSETAAAAKSTENTPKPAGFVFAAPKTTGDEGGFKFEVNKKSEDSQTTKNEEKKAEATFSFGLPKTVETPKGSENKCIFGAPTTAANGKPHFVFGIPKSEGPAPDANKTAPKMTFGVQSSESSSEISSIFGSEISQKTSVKDADKSESFSSKSSSASGSEQQAVSTITSSFASPNPVASSAASNLPSQNRAPFTFSEPKSKVTAEATIVPNFGENSLSTSAASSNFPKTNEIAATASPFGVAPSSSPSPSLPAATPADGKSAAAAASSVFSVFPTFNSPSPAFGAPTAAPSSQPLFGNNNNTPAPVFGGGSVPNFGTTGNSGETPSIFAKPPIATAAAPANPPGIFTFGTGTSQQSAVAAAPTPASSFSFTGNATPASSASKSVFAFGGANAVVPAAASGAAAPTECFGNAPANNAAGAFGTPAAQNPAPSPFTFNAAPPKQDPPSFGQATGAIPSMFGTQTPAPSIGQTQPAQAASTGFNFGAAAPAPAAGVFSFGGGMSQPASAPSSGFNFNAPSSSPAIAFDPHTRPSFNFTGGSAPTAFNATPQPATTRKIKKAVRRMPQR